MADMRQSFVMPQIGRGRAGKKKGKVGKGEIAIQNTWYKCIYSRETAI